ENCDLSLISVQDSSFREVKFIKTKVVGVNWTAADWPNIPPSKSPINFSECVLDYSTFIGLTLNRIKFENCKANDLEFSDASLVGADFRGTTLTKSRFNNTNLTEANFEGASEYNIDVTKNNLRKAKFSLPEAYALVHSIEHIFLKDG
ncbi:MAG: pentapeptide repeat-containing protein, partial [Chloroflexota bacterium]